METLYLSENIGAVERVPRKTGLQRNYSNSPSHTPHEHYKLMVAIPLLDSRINQLEDRIEGEGRFCRIFLCLVPSVLLSKSCSL